MNDFSRRLQHMMDENLLQAVDIVTRSNGYITKSNVSQWLNNRCKPSSKKIAVLSDGMLAEEGTHRELMEKNGTYALLFRTQASRYLDEENRETARNTTRPATEKSPDEEAESPI